MQVGTLVSHNHHGLSKITRVHKARLGGKEKEFLVLATANNDMTIMVPFDSALEFIRPLTTIQKIESLFEQVDGCVEVRQTTWNQRYREFDQRLQLGTFEVWLDVAVKLMSLRNTKDLSFGERKMLDKCFMSMALEIAAQNSMTKETALNYVTKTLFQRVQ